MEIASLILGIVSIILGLIPFCGMIAIIPAVIGIVLGIVDIVVKSKKSENKTMGIIGLILSSVSLILVVFWAFMWINTDNSNTVENNTNQISNNTVDVETIKVTVIDFSSMSKDEIQNWCFSNDIVCKIIERYSDTVEKGSFLSQSIEANKTIYQGDSITIIYSLGKEPTTEYKNALKKAESYSKSMNMSKQAIYEQLISEYGEQFPADAAQYAIDNLVADWKANALAKAKVYQNKMNMSKQAIYEQLISEYGEQFTEEEAKYAIEHLE